MIVVAAIVGIDKGNSKIVQGIRKLNGKILHWVEKLKIKTFGRIIKGLGIYQLQYIEYDE